MPLIVHAADMVVRPALSRLVDYCDAEQSFMEDANIRMEIGHCVEFLTTIFAESDLVLFRPIETWIEQGKKRSRPAYSDTFHCKAVPKALSARLARLLRTAEEKRLNLFFGVCPRLGDGGRFDLAWQIRTVRALWADIDHVTVDEARERVTKAGLPVPSVIVNSGNGVHLYWLLDEARVIDDVGNPPAVEREWTERENGKKKPRGWCQQHQPKENRPSPSRRGYGRDWKRVRAAFARENPPICSRCGITADDKAMHVDHIVSIRKAPEQRLDITNLQWLCRRCHSRKTREDA